MTAPESFVLYFALLLAVFAASFAAYLYFEMRKRISGGDDNRVRFAEQFNSEIGALKREHGHLSETVARFRAQSLAGITETINEREQEIALALKEALEDALKIQLEHLSKEFDIALEAVVDRVGLLEKKGEPYDGRADVNLLGRRLEQLEVSAARTKDLKALGAGQVIDRFLSSIEDPDERFKCLLASFDSIADSATLGKLAVAYPGKNSWIILKELSDHGVVSEVAAWAMIAGARLSQARGDEKLALHLYQGARAAFITCGGNHDGLWAVNTALAKMSDGGAAENYGRDAMANLFALKSNTAQSAAPMQLAEFYQREDRLEVAAVLLLTVSELHLELDSLAYQASLRIVQSLAQVLLAQYQASMKNLSGDTFTCLAGSLANLRNIYNRCPSLEREYKVGLLLAILHTARIARDGDAAVFAAGLLLDQCQPQVPGMTEALATDFADKIFKLSPAIFESVLVTLDSLELTRKRRTMPLLGRLTAAFMDTNNLTKASSCGAKLVDCALDSYGDAAAETIGPISTLAQVYRRMQRIDLVEECFRQILEIQYKVFSSESEEIVETLLNLSDVCRMQKNLGEAEIFLESAIETGEELVRKEKSSEKLATLLNRARTWKSVTNKDDDNGADRHKEPVPVAHQATVGMPGGDGDEQLDEEANALGDPDSGDESGDESDESDESSITAAEPDEIQAQHAETTV